MNYTKMRDKCRHVDINFILGKRIILNDEDIRGRRNGIITAS